MDNKLLRYIACKIDERFIYSTWINHRKICGEGKVVVHKGTNLYIQSQGRFECESSFVSIGGKHWLSDKRKTSIFISNDGLFHCKGKVYIAAGNKITISKNAKLVFLGENYINTDSEIDCFNSIAIGKGTIIGPHVTIRDSDNHLICDERFQVSKQIIIGNHVWIGLNSIILKGVTIGDGAVIGAGSVVTKDVPPKCLVVGNPSRIVRKNIDWKI